MQDMRDLFDGQPSGTSAGKSEKKLATTAPTTDLPA